jgi:protein-disulfide isomerase
MAVTFVHSPLPNHVQAEHAARAAECADAQGQFAAMKAVLFEKQAVFGTVSWVELGRLAKIADVDRFKECVESTQPVERLIQGKLLTTKFGVRGTPTILVNGWVLPRPPSTDELDQMVRDVLDGRTPKLK